MSSALFGVPPAQKLFTEVLVRIMKRWSFVGSFRSTASKALTEIEDTLAIEQRQLMEDFLNSPEGKKIFVPINPGAPPSDNKKLADTLSPLITRGTIDGTQAAVDTASIVFCHSIVDAAALDFCRVTALCAPEDWEEDFTERKIRLADVKNATYEQIFQQKLDDFLKELDGKSLLKKAELLFLKCKPPAGFSPMRNYKYDPDRVKGIDDLRHEIVHGDGCDKGIPNVEDDLDYMFKTAFFFMGLVNQRYGLMISLEVAQEIFTPKIIK